MNKKKASLLTLSGLALTGCILFSALGTNVSAVFGGETTTWKHYQAVMPTAQKQGIREYWVDCVGGNPVFEAPQVASTDAVLTDVQVDAILANQKDPRIIPTLTRIQNAVAKNVDGDAAADYTFVNDAYGFVYLDQTTKNQIPNANEESIVAAKANFDKYFKVVYDVAKDNLPGKDQAFVSFARGYDNEKGDVLEISTTEGLNGGTSQLYFYGLNPNSVTYGENDVLSFSVYSPFAAVNNPATSQTYWCDAYGTTKKFNATPLGWTEVSGKGNELNTNGNLKTAFNGAISLQRYVNGTIDPYQGTYKMTSIIAQRELDQEGDVVGKGKNNLIDAKTWNNCGETEIKYGVNTEHGKATQVDIKSKGNPIELKWTLANYNAFKKFNFVRMYVYAKTTQRVYVSLSAWRNDVVSLQGLDPKASDNGTVANSYASVANVFADKWNIIDIPAAYFAKDADNSFFIEIWNDKNESKDGWLFSDLQGHYGDAYVDGPGMLIFHGGACSVASDFDDDLGLLTKATLSNANPCFIKTSRALDISSYENVKFSVKNTSTSNVNFTFLKITDALYGNQVKGSYLTATLAPGVWTEITINVEEYFGTYASATTMYFQLKGAAGDVCLFTGIIGQ